MTNLITKERNKIRKHKKINLLEICSLKTVFGFCQKSLETNIVISFVAKTPTKMDNVDITKKICSTFVVFKRAFFFLISNSVSHRYH